MKIRDKNVEGVEAYTIINTKREEKTMYILIIFTRIFVLIATSLYTLYINPREPLRIDKR